MKILIPIVMLLLGTAAGVGAGVFLRPDPEPSAETNVEETVQDDLAEEETKPEGPALGREYVKLSNQFVVPLVDDERISAMVVMTLSVEVAEGDGQAVYDLEPKIRDVFLRVLFDHAAIGGFRGAFANNENLDTVRRSLRQAAQKDFGDDFINDVLIFEIARQDY